jgi:hypothetical protein
MANAEAVLPDITDLEGNYLARTETCAHCQHIPDLEVFIRPAKRKELLHFGIGQDTTFRGLARKGHEASAGFAGINSFIAAQRRATVPTDITLLIVLAFSSFSSLSQSENAPRSDLWISDAFLEQ